MARLAAAAIAALVLTGAACPKESTTTPPPAKRSTELPRPRDPDIAVQEELDAARRAGTLAAYDLFVARNDGHPLAEIGKRERAAIAARNPR